MDIANTNKPIALKCRPEELESFWLRQVGKLTNRRIAQRIGRHETYLSRNKSDIIQVACAFLCELGLPAGAVEPEGCEPTVIIQGEEAREAAKALLSMLELLREPKEKTPNA